MADEIVKTEPTIMEIVQQIAASPNARDQVEVVKELLTLKEHQEDRQAKRAFADALQQLQAKMPEIKKDGAIWVKGILRSRYATIDQLDDVLRPLMAEFGFSFQMSEIGIRESMREFAGTLIHKQGYEKTLTINLPLDKSEFRSAVQSEGSTISYARRQLYKAHFNIVERGQDDDGSGENVEPIDAEQLKDLDTRMKDVKANMKLFCQYFHIEKVADLKKADLARAHEMLEQKKTGPKK